jgi:hypothetical protein
VQARAVCIEKGIPLSPMLHCFSSPLNIFLMMDERGRMSLSVGKEARVSKDFKLK